MFGIIRNKFQTVQEGITASLRGLSVGDQPPRDQAAGLPVKLSAGADLLHKYQTEWSELHKRSEENAHQAQVVDSVIARLHHTCEKQSLEIVRMSTALANLPQLIDSVQLLMDQIASLQGLFEEVETGVLRLEDMIEIQELQEKQLEHRFQFALYKEKKLSELESLKVKLAREHADKVLQYEMKQQRLLKERQATFQQAFNQDLHEFKQTGFLPGSDSQRSVGRGPSLVEVTLDPGDLAELDNFLNESSDGQVS